MTTVLLAPLDPVHDNAIKLLRRKLEAAGYTALTMPPGVSEEEVIALALQERPAAILVSRTLGYKVAETLGHLVDLAEAAGLRPNTRLGVGGMAITQETGAELGFDGCFVGALNMDDVIAFIEGRPQARQQIDQAAPRPKPDLTEGFTYAFRDEKIARLLDSISEQLLEWVKDKRSPAIERARLRAELLAETNPQSRTTLLERYLSFCDGEIQAFYREGRLPAGVRRLEAEEIARAPQYLTPPMPAFQSLRHNRQKPLFFAQYGTGCPIMDAAHVRIAEAWGIDGVLHFDPSWGAQREGLLEGLLTHEHDGTIITFENLHFIRSFMNPATLWNVRGHRGLNTPETQVLAHAAGADLLKINIPYGSTGGGTDPERLAVDGVYSVRLAGEFGLPFDIPGNDELSGVPPP
jgi:methylmalonyl-CoA mutase cobalamin-binding subunit